MLAGPLLVVAGVVGVCFLLADRRSETEFFMSFAQRARLALRSRGRSCSR